MIRVLVVDDSPLMRRIIARILSRDPLLQLAGTAENGEEALEKIEALRPDVVTMDLEMPRMNGLEALKVIMSRMPLPVIMLSAATREGADVTLDALDAGACDFLAKELRSGAFDIDAMSAELIRKIKAVVKKPAGVETDPARDLEAARCTPAARLSDPAVVAIGASTGGPRILQQVLSGLPGCFPIPLLIAQHMPKAFTPLSLSGSAKQRPST